MEKNRILEAFSLTILLFAGIHLIVLYGLAFYHRDLERVNIFRLLDFQLFFPEIYKGTASFILSYGFFFLVFMVVFFFLSKRRN